ncbi:aldose 1-epimerase [Weizmannia acidiproducens]|uniref:aldose 1-epimerase n=1 Tax=Heyndrickxia acidiproducens TaxID=1121084 RepID=UPI001B7F8764
MEKFTFAGRPYQFSINEDATHNHLHGFFYARPWKIYDKGYRDGESYVELVQIVDELSEIYRYYPNHFKMYLRYTLSSEGLEQSVKIVNESSNVCRLCWVAIRPFKHRFAKQAQKRTVF